MLDALSTRRKRSYREPGQTGAEDLRVTVDLSLQASNAMTAVAQITGDVRHIDSGAQQVAAAIEELDGSMRMISENSGDATGEMGEVSKIVSEMSERMVKAAKAVDWTAEAITTLERQTGLVVDRVLGIANAVEQLEAIGRKTNILAINAAIEATRAGEAGRGFGVVADQIQRLFADSRATTEGARRLVTEMRSTVEHLQGVVEAARGATKTAGEIAESTKSAAVAANAVVARTKGRMEEIANAISEQTEATRDLANGAERIAGSSRVATARAEQVIEAVSASEAHINLRLDALAAEHIPDYVLHRAKADHFLWKKKLAEMMVGRRSLELSELTDHHSCRLGKWYDNVADPQIRNHPAYISLLPAHATVHHKGKEVVRLHAMNDRTGAEAAFEEMERASREVVRLLDMIIAR